MNTADEVLVFIDAVRKVAEIRTAQFNIRKGSKQNFNSFQAVVGDKLSNEKYHSNVIAYLLDPNETHDCNDFFLAKFFETLKQRKFDVPDSRDFLKGEVLTRRERHISPRLIDITLESKNRKDWILFIENKLNSGERENQVLDYSLFAKEYDSWLGVYLTLPGDIPQSIQHDEELSRKIICLSYNDIIAWLEACVMDRQMIRYSNITSFLFTYINVIKYILNQLEDMEQKEAFDYLSQKVKVEELKLIVENREQLFKAVDAVVESKRNEFLEKVKEVLKKYDGEIVGEIEIEGHHYFKIKGSDIMLFVESSYPEADDGFRGFWWGLYRNESSQVKPKGHICGLGKDGYWRAMQFEDIEDGNSINDKVTAKILEAISSKKIEELIARVADDIIGEMRERLSKQN